MSVDQRGSVFLIPEFAAPDGHIAGMFLDDLGTVPIPLGPINWMVR
jgi:hypothetical protein